jgi:lysophospholipase L1-like esterase
VIFETGQKIVFIGDSITDCDRQGASAPYGNGYVSMIYDFLTARYPEHKLTIVNKGVGGNTVLDLDKRWEADVVAEKPNWLAVCIGINDVWRHFDGNTPQAVPIAEYADTLRRLLKRAQDATGAKLILAEPYMIQNDPSDMMRKLMVLYEENVDLIASEFGAKLVKTQTAFDSALTTTQPSDWSTDHIHPNAPGHALIALAFLRVIEFAL